MIKLSSYQRKDHLEQMARGDLDVIVIGGGITGAGIALDASTRGLSAGLFEMQDFAAGTSSRSTKLIHGGLRYLKQGDVKLVQEVGREREILYRNAPHLVIPERMLLPIVEKGSFGKLATSFGLYLYDRLAGVKKQERRVMLNKEETARQEPLLRNDILLGGGLYYEYRTDDARLTIEVIKTACRHGSCCVNFAEVFGFIYDRNGKIAGVKVKDLLTNQTYDVRAKKIVNAAGPWVDTLRACDRSLDGKRLHHTKGIHLVIPYHKIPIKQSIYFDAGDGRMIFAIPREEKTYVGTTDTNYTGKLEQPQTTVKDVDYILSAVNRMMPSVRVTRDDIVSSWAGLRPLIHEPGKSPSQLSRKDEIFLSNTGLLSIAGGKLTGYRKMAERVVDFVLRQLSEEEGYAYKGTITDQLKLSGGEFESRAEISSFIDKMYNKHKSLGIPRSRIEESVRLFGSNVEHILTIAERMVNEPIQPDLFMLMAELRYSINEEMATGVSDFLIRRTGKLYFGRDSIAPVYPEIVNAMAELLHWSEQEKSRQLQSFEREFEEVVRFKWEQPLKNGYTTFGEDPDGRE